jgi:hypothetical protein
MISRETRDCECVGSTQSVRTERTLFCSMYVIRRLALQRVGKDIFGLQVMFDVWSLQRVDIFLPSE